MLGVLRSILFNKKINTWQRSLFLRFIEGGYSLFCFWSLPVDYNFHLAPNW
jgi:hypothetical protein